MDKYIAAIVGPQDIVDPLALNRERLNSQQISQDRLLGNNSIEVETPQTIEVQDQ